MSAEHAAVFAIIVAAGSELIAMSKLSSNSWVQLIVKALQSSFPKKTPGKTD